MGTKRAYLIVRADETMRIVTRWPSLRSDEIAYRLNVNFPSRPWGHIAEPSIDITIETSLPPAIEVDDNPIHPQPAEV